MESESTQSFQSLGPLLSGMVELEEELQINDLRLDSRDIRPGALFIACPGETVDRRDFIGDAVAAGAVGVLVEAGERIADSYPVPVIPVPCLREHLGEIAMRFFGQPAQGQRILGITGTNGKTTVAWLTAEALNRCGLPAAFIGTVGCGVPPGLCPTTNTTPDAIELQRLLANWRDRVRHTVMEVSSHALVQRRVADLRFFVAVFTNLGHNHLDYHRDMRDYAESKFRLFEQPELCHAVINLDDEYGRELLGRISDRLDTLAYTLDERRAAAYRGQCALVTGRMLDIAGGACRMHLHTPWGEAEMPVTVSGEFNHKNLLAAVCCLGLCSIPLEQVVEVLPSVSLPPGRMERFQAKDSPLLVVDYAHSPEALAAVLGSLRTECQGKLYCVFGCGGNRYVDKRMEMGRIAEALADQVVLTNDNPRDEDPDSIIGDILRGMSNPHSSVVQNERAKAITRACEMATSEDIVLIAGMGHEVYQQVGDKRVPFSDRKLARQLTSGGCA